MTGPAAELPELLPELWGAIARATVEAEGCTPEALARLSLVSVAWRDGLKGEDEMPYGCFLRAGFHPALVATLTSSAAI